MKVKELKDLLSSVDENRVVVMSSDGEGNSYSPLEGYTDEMSYIPDSTWSGETRYTTFTKELAKEGYGEEDCANGEGEPCLILYPVN